MEFAIICGKISQLGKKLLVPGLLDSMLYKLDMQGPQESECWTLPQQGRMVLLGSCFTEEMVRQSADHGGKWLTNCQYRRDGLANFLLYWKVCQILWPVDWRWRWIPQHCRGNLGDCPGSQMSLLFLQLLEVVYSALLVYLNNNTSSGSLMELKMRKLS